MTACDHMDMLKASIREKESATMRDRIFTLAPTNAP
jgi:hypothetical protein